MEHVTEYLSMIDQVTNDVEFDVLNAMYNAYNKAYTILEYNESSPMLEDLFFMEADNSNSEPNKTNILKKLIDYIKKMIENFRSKIKGLFKNGKVETKSGIENISKDEKSKVIDLDNIQSQDPSKSKLAKQALGLLAIGGLAGGVVGSAVTDQAGEIVKDKISDMFFERSLSEEEKNFIKKNLLFSESTFETVYPYTVFRYQKQFFDVRIKDVYGWEFIKFMDEKGWVFYRMGPDIKFGIKDLENIYKQLSSIISEARIVVQKNIDRDIPIVDYMSAMKDSIQHQEYMNETFDNIKKIMDQTHSKSEEEINKEIVDKNSGDDGRTNEEKNADISYEQKTFQTSKEFSKKILDDFSWLLTNSQRYITPEEIKRFKTLDSILSKCEKFEGDSLIAINRGNVVMHNIAEKETGNKSENNTPISLINDLKRLYTYCSFKTSPVGFILGEITDFSQETLFPASDKSYEIDTNVRGAWTHDEPDAYEIGKTTKGYYFFKTKSATVPFEDINKQPSMKYINLAFEFGDKSTCSLFAKYLSWNNDKLVDFANRCLITSVDKGFDKNYRDAAELSDYYIDGDQFRNWLNEISDEINGFQKQNPGGVINE